MKEQLRQTRILAVTILYMIDFNNSNDIKSHLDIIDSPYLDKALDYVNKVVENINQIDEIIESTLVNYTLSRLNLVDKAIIRLATYELLNKVPATICINEAIEITKEYSDLGDNTSSKFNNKLLDNIKKKISNINE